MNAPSKAAFGHGGHVFKIWPSLGRSIGQEFLNFWDGEDSFKNVFLQLGLAWNCKIPAVLKNSFRLLGCLQNGYPEFCGTLGK